MRRVVSLFLVAVLTVALMGGGGEAQDRSQARSMVVSRDGIVASESPLASQAAATILARGGNAMDAAVAANAVMGVVAPMANGIGGDLFAIVYEAKTGRVYGLNASGWSAAAAQIEELRQAGQGSMPSRGIHSVTVPGAVEGWAMLLQRFGKMKFAEVLAPAIHYAETGFPVTEMVAASWAQSEDLIGKEPEAARVYFPEGHAPRVGTLFRNPDLAWSLKQIAEKGRDAYYKGPITQRILAFSKEKGGHFTEADFAEFHGEWVDPLTTTYRGWTVYEIPPNSQGIAALQMLNLMEEFPLPTWGHNTAETLHAVIEAKKIAYGDLLRLVGDPKFTAVPVAQMLLKPDARERAARVDRARASCPVFNERTAPRPGNDTTYLSVVDRDGNMVSLIQSNYESRGFGSNLVAPGTGFCLHNRGALFSLNRNSPNVFAPRKRPLHTIIPAMMSRGDVRIAFGIMGGWNQAQAHAQFVSNVVDFGMNIQAALEAPRFTKATFTGCDVMMEARIPADVRAELEKRGHQIEVRGDFSPQMGSGQAVLRNFKTSVNYGASDPRKDGLAIAEPPPLK